MGDVPARALFHTSPGCVEIRELPAPRPVAGEVLVRTVCSGISGGTERLVYRGEIPADLVLDDTIDALGGTEEVRDMLADDVSVPLDDVDQGFTDDQRSHRFDATAWKAGNTVLWWTVTAG